MQEEDIQEINEAGYGSAYFLDFQREATITDEYCQELLQTQNWMNYPELWFFRQLFFKCKNFQKLDVFNEFYHVYHTWFSFEQAVGFDVGAIERIDVWKQQQITENRPLLWLMRRIYTELLDTKDKREEFNKYEAAFKRWLDFEVTIRPLTQTQLDQIDALENVLEQEGDFAAFMSGLLDQKVFNAEQEAQLKKTYPEWFPKTPRMSKNSSTNNFLQFFCSNPEEEVAKTVTPSVKRKNKSASAKKRAVRNEEYDDLGSVHDPEDEFVQGGDFKVVSAVTTRRKQSPNHADGSSDNKKSDEPKVKLVKLDADLSRFGKEKLSKIPGLVCNGNLVEWKNDSQSMSASSCAEFATMGERDQVRNDILTMADLVGYVVPKGYITERSHCLYVNSVMLELLYSNFILIDILQDYKKFSVHLVMLYSAIKPEVLEVDYTWQLMQFLQMSYDQQFELLNECKYLDKDKEFFKFLHSYSANFAKALISRDQSLGNLIKHFATFTDDDQNMFEAYIDQMLDVSECPEKIRDDIKEYMTNILALSRKKMLVDQSYAARIYVRYLMATEPKFKMRYLQDLDAQCINRDYLLKPMESAFKYN